MKAETFKFTVEVEVADADGEPIREGSVLRSTEDGTVGVVVQIVRPGSYVNVPFAAVGDVHICTSYGSTRVTNQYAKWRHVPHNDQTYEQRHLSWRHRPYDHDNDRGISEPEGLAIDGIMALLPDDIVNWENGPWPDRLNDALTFLVDHLNGLQPKAAEGKEGA